MYFLPQLITGEAERCFRRYVLPTFYSRKWKPKEVSKLLQEHCFPDDHKVRLYKQLRSAKQGNRKVRPHMLKRWSSLRDIFRASARSFLPLYSWQA